MKTFLTNFLTLAMMFNAAVTAGADEVANTEVRAKPGFHCLINKSFSLLISYERSGQVTLESRDFMNRADGAPITLSRPGMQVIEYGNVTMISQDFGRSGYAFIRIEQNAENQYEGLVDINVFFNQSRMNTGGNLQSVTCYKNG